MSVIIDRRLNDRNKSATNRERFIRRYKAHVQRAVTDMVAERSIRDMERGGQVKIPVKDIAEPSFRHRPGPRRSALADTPKAPQRNPPSQFVASADCGRVNPTRRENSLSSSRLSPPPPHQGALVSASRRRPLLRRGSGAVG